MSHSPTPLPSAEKLRLESLGVLPVLLPTVGIVGLLSAFLWVVVFIKLPMLVIHGN